MFKKIKNYENYSINEKGETARELNLDASTISKVCRGQNKTHSRFIFKCTS